MEALRVLALGDEGMNRLQNLGHVGDPALAQQ